MAKMSKNELIARLNELGIAYDPKDSYRELMTLLPEEEGGGSKAVVPAEKKTKPVKMKKVKVDRKPNPNAATGLRTIEDHEKRITAIENKVYGQVEIEVPDTEE